MRCPHCRKSFPKLKTSHLCETVADQTVDWFPKYLVHTKGDFAGHPFVLDEWQRRDIVAPIFGTLVYDIELQAWIREIRQAYVELPRKSGKSELGAGIGVKMTFADGEWGGEIYSVARDLDQANRTFAVGKTMVDSNAALAKRARIYKRVIEVPKTGNVWKVIPGDAEAAEGGNPSCVLFDELHTQRRRELFDTMTTGQGARAQPLFIGFSTAGVDRNSVCWEQHEYGERVHRGIIVDRTFYYVRYGIAEGEDWEDEEVWRRSNPSIGSFQRIGPMRDEYRKAKASPARQNAFRRYYLNDWVSQYSRWLDIAAWDGCRRRIDERKLEGERCFVACDASASTHIGAVCLYFPDEERPTAIFRFFIPADRVEDLDGATAGSASTWIRGKHMTVNEGNLLDDEAILKQIERDLERFDVQEVGFKPGGVTAPIVRELLERDVVGFHAPQTIKKLSPATNEWERLILAGAYRQGGNPVMRYMVDGIVVRRDSDGAIKPDPEKSLVNISGPMAAVLALDGALRDVDEDDEAGELVTYS
jgi:phage terminase large subunit-like protein